MDKHDKSDRKDKQDRAVGMALIGAVLLVVAYWIIDMLIHAFIFRRSSLVEQLFTPGPVELYSRTFTTLLVLAITTVFGIVHQRYRHSQTILEHEDYRIREIAQSLGEGLYVMDSSARLTFMNHEAERLLGWSADELLGKPVHECFHIAVEGKELDASECPIIGVLKTGKTYRSDDALFARKDKPPIRVSCTSTPLVDNGEVVAVITVFQDITERKKIEQELKESEVRYRTLAEAAHDMIFIIDRDDTVRYVNKFAALSLGRKPEELVGTRRSELFQADVDEHQRRRLHSVFETGSALYSEEKTAFPDRDRWLSTWLAPVSDDKGNIVSVMGISRDITESKRAKELSDALNDINAAIGSTLDFDMIMRRVIVDAVKVLGCDSGAIALREDEHRVLSYIYGMPAEYTGLRISKKQAKHMRLAAKEGTAIVVDDTMNDDRVDPHLMGFLGVRSLVDATLIVKGEPAGDICFHHRSKVRPFESIEIDFVNKIAASVSLALENARLYAVEHNIADTLQEALLTVPEEIKGIEFGHIYRSATEEARVGGDFYDVFELGDGKIAVVVGDVSGKGLEAARLAVLVKTAVKAYTHKVDNPAAIMSETNELLIKTPDSAMFVTAFVGLLDVKSGHLAYCSAGHPPPLLRRKSGHTECLSTTSPIIGAFPGLSYNSDRIDLQPGDILFLYTDGVTEARKKDEFFGEKRLTKTLEELSWQTAAGATSRLFESITSFTNGKLSDDIALLAIALSRDEDSQSKAA